MTFRDFVAGPWKTACHDRSKPSTRRRVESALRTQLLPAFGSLPLGGIDAARVEAWFGGYSRTAPGGANRVLDVLLQVLNHAVRCGHLDANPARGVVRNRRVRPTRFLSQAEVERLRAALDAHGAGRGPGGQQADVIRLLLLTGCRKAEIVTLRWAEVDGGVARLRDSKTGRRTVWLNEQARAILARRPRNGPYVFPAPGGAGPRTLELSLWKKVRREAGIADVRLHDLRHTFASQAVIAGVPLPVVSRLLGHASQRMSLRYAHVADRDVETAAERIGAALEAALQPGEAA